MVSSMTLASNSGGGAPVGMALQGASPSAVLDCAYQNGTDILNPSVWSNSPAAKSFLLGAGVFLAGRAVRALVPSLHRAVFHVGKGKHRLGVGLA